LESRREFGAGTSFQHSSFPLPYENNKPHHKSVFVPQKAAMSGMVTLPQRV